MKRLSPQQMRKKFREFFQKHPIISGVVAGEITEWLDRKTEAVREFFSAPARPSASAPIPPGASAPIPPRNRTAYAYITNWETVSVIDTLTDKVVATIPVGWGCGWVAATPYGKLYVLSGSNVFQVIDTATNTVTKSIVPLGNSLHRVAASPEGSKVYVTGFATTGNWPHATGCGQVLVIDTTMNLVTATVRTGLPSPFGLAVSPDGGKVYVANVGRIVTPPEPPTLSVIDTCDKYRDRHNRCRPLSRDHSRRGDNPRWRESLRHQWRLQSLGD
jgi:YVTN family beta-propeller protein